MLPTEREKKGAGFEGYVDPIASWGPWSSGSMASEGEREKFNPRYRLESALMGFLGPRGAEEGG